MRSICKVCKDKDSCSYLKRGRESECIDVQTSDYGYDEAVEKAAKWLTERTMFGVHPCGGAQLVMEFKKEMEL